jgi:hypothetical protein
VGTGRPASTFSSTRRLLLGQAAFAAAALAAPSQAAARPAAAARAGSRRLVIWRGLDAWRTEVSSVRVGEHGLEAAGTQIGVDPLPYRLDYRLDASDGFVTRRLEIEAEGSRWRRRLDLRHDGKGSWTCKATASGKVSLPDPGGPVAPLQGALDCDLGLSPQTNTMPIRRSGLHRRPGSADFLMAWVSVPDLAVLASPQRYEHVRNDADGSVVRYVDRGLFPGFEAEVQVDRRALVVVYPGLARQVKSGATRD